MHRHVRAGSRGVRIYLQNAICSVTAACARAGFCRVAGERDRSRANRDRANRGRANRGRANRAAAISVQSCCCRRMLEARGSVTALRKSSLNT